MNKLSFIAFLCLCITACTTGGKSNESPAMMKGYKLTPVSFDRVEINDGFWKPKCDLNRDVTIPYAFGKCEETGRIDNFAVAAGMKEGSYKGERYNDSDVFKIIEGACYSLMTFPDPDLRHYVDSLVSIIASAQEDDGYLYTTRTIDPVNMAPGAGRERWTDERVSHELYNVGHMYEAAVAHFLATGSDVFLNVALKNAELVNNEFGWGKREIAPGHQEIELGLVKLCNVTGDSRWLDLARFFIDVRGRQGDYLHHPAGSRFEVYNDSVYLQMHKPVLEQNEAVGHAVRGAYMYAAMADIAEATGDISYLDASRQLWNDVVDGKIYITGGIGSKEYGEAFGESFELPNMSAYTETCASVANVFWNHRLFSATGEAKYMDILERTLYNGLISGIGADGCRFFYPNPLESDGRFERAGWFDCSCCPGNIARFLPALGQYIYSVSGSDIYINLFIGSKAEIETAGGTVSVVQETDYPWSGSVTIRISPEGNNPLFKVKVRIPSWTGSSPMPGNLYQYINPPHEGVTIKVNGEEYSFTDEQGYATIERRWSKGDEISLSLPVEPRFIRADEAVVADKGRVAVGAGPLVYCLEETDNGKVRELTVDPQTEVTFKYDPSLFGGTGILKFLTTTTKGTDKEVRAVPYYSWANRGSGEMTVWIKTEK